MVRPAQKPPINGFPIYQFKVILVDTHPPIWRRFLMPGYSLLSTLHRTIQRVMGWNDSHLHQFRIDGKVYSVPDAEWEEKEIIDEKKARLYEFIDRGFGEFTYEYDFGDGWEHQIVFEKEQDAEPDLHYPHCLGGARACPPEDCGGTTGYEQFLQAIADPRHPDHSHLSEWIGGSFDPEAFDLKEINRQLKAIRAPV